MFGGIEVEVLAETPEGFPTVFTIRELFNTLMQNSKRVVVALPSDLWNMHPSDENCNGFHPSDDAVVTQHFFHLN